MDQRQDFLTVAEVAARLKLTEDTIRRWCQSGKLKSTLLSRRAGYRISVGEVERLLAATNIESTSDSTADTSADSSADSSSD